MNRNWKEIKKQKHQFKSNYCLTCQQRKICSSVWDKKCCPCFLAKEKLREKNWLREEQANFVRYLNQKENGRLLAPQEPANYYLFHGKFYPFKQFQKLAAKLQQKMRKWWQRIAQKCQCETSSKIRVSSDYFTSCQGCEKEITTAKKKRIIKNRNDPRFWGLTVPEKVLCSACLTEKIGAMPALRRAKFKEYQKLGRL